jgi:hypothetical protein
MVTRSYFLEDKLDGAKMTHSPPSIAKDKAVPSTRLTEWRLTEGKLLKCACHIGLLQMICVIKITVVPKRL